MNQVLPPETERRNYTDEELDQIVNNYGSVRRTLFPVAMPEMVKALGTMFFMFVLIFLFSLIKATKNASVSAGIDPSAISYIKLFIVTPVNIWIIAMAQKIVANNSVPKSFDIVLIGYGVAWLVYGFVFVILNFNWFIPRFWSVDLFADDKMAYRGLTALYCLIGIVTSTRYVLYYLLSEIFGSLILSYMFWSFTNEYMSKKQALRINPLFIICANVGLLCSSMMADYLNKATKSGSYAFNQVYNYTSPLFVAGVVFFLYFYKKRFQKLVLRNYGSSSQQQRGSNRRKLTLLEAVKISFSSKLVIAISIAVLTYNLSMNLVDSFTLRTIEKRATMSSGDKAANTTAAEVYAQKWSAIIVILVSFIPSNKMIMGGFFLIYALMPCLASIFISFGVVLFQGLSLNEGSFLGIRGGSLMLQEQIAIHCQILMKIVKFAMFDISKEALSMRINSEHRALFKGVYDGHFGKIGKSMGSLVSISSDFYHGVFDIRLSAFPVFFLLSGLNVAWFLMMLYAAKKFNEAISRNADIDCGWIGEPQTIKSK